MTIAMSTILWVGALAGFTIFLGLPVARLSLSTRMRLFLNAASVGILIFLFVEITYHVIEQIESAMKLSVMGYRPPSSLWVLVVIFVFGFAFSLLGLVAFEGALVRRQEGRVRSPLRLASMIALGIGLHNFSEGLVIGQQFAGGGMDLGFLLAIGFALHNATEGFGIAAPLASQKPTLIQLFLLGLLGGGPTFLGTLIGTRWTSEPVEALFLSLAAGAILYIVGELIHLGKIQGGHLVTSLGLLFGFLLAFGSDLVIERATTVGFLEKSHGHEVTMTVGDYFFKPNQLTLEAGQPVRMVIENQGSVEHEIEILGIGAEIEQVVPWQGRGVVLLYPRFAGTYPFICDMPGHLMKGMRGELTVVAR